ITARRTRGIAAVPDGNRKILGPAGSGHAVAETNGAAPRARASAGAMDVRARAQAAKPASRPDADWKPQTTFTQGFTVAHPVDVVWDFFGNIGEVASCLPGASLAGEPVDGH